MGNEYLQKAYMASAPLSIGVGLLSQYIPNIPVRVGIIIAYGVGLTYLHFGYKPMKKSR